MEYARAIVDELGEIVAWCKDLTEEEKERNARIQAEIDDLKEQIKLCKTGNIYCDVDVKEARLKIKLLKNALYK